jgi:hypothetical protein
MENEQSPVKSLKEGTGAMSLSPEGKYFFLEHLLLNKLRFCLKLKFYNP